MSDMEKTLRFRTMFLRTVGETGYGAAFLGCTIFLLFPFHIPYSLFVAFHCGARSFLLRFIIFCPLVEGMRQQPMNSCKVGMSSGSSDWEKKSSRFTGCGALMAMAIVVIKKK